MTCERCYKPLDVGEHGHMLCPLEARRRSAAVWQDSIEGGLVIEHGLCNPDGSPRTYYSRTEIREACKARGLVPWTDIHTEDKTKPAIERGEWLKSAEAQRERRGRVEMREQKRLANMRAGR
jgi:hypothetical protein